MTTALSRTALLTPRAAMQSSKLDPICFTKPGVVDICIYRGDSGRIRVRITDALGTPVDVTTATWDCDIRLTPDDPVVLCSPDVVPVPGIPNAVDVVLSAECSAGIDWPDTVDGYWDLEMTKDGEVTTILAGKVKLTKDVSRA